jgi:uncharacterized membrane protein required for colicin V production
MNWLDAGAAIGLAAFALRGFLKGLVAESLAFFGLLLSAGVTLYGAAPAADLFARAVGIGRPLATLAAAIVLFLLVEFAWHLGLHFLVGKSGKDGFRRSAADRVGGALFGLVKGVVMVSLLLVSLERLPMPRAYRRAAGRTEYAGVVRGAAPWIGRALAQVLPEDMRRRYEALRGRVAPLAARPGAIPGGPPGAPGPGEPPGGSRPSKSLGQSIRFSRPGADLPVRLRE